MKRLILLALFACSAPGNEWGSSAPRDRAECRNLMRLISNSCYNGEGLGVALACRSQAGSAYDDCMISKGYELPADEPEDAAPRRKAWSKP
jgi:hypothetical protein